MAEEMPRPPLAALYKGQRAGVGSAARPVAELWLPASRATGGHREHARQFGAPDRRRRRGVRALTEAQLRRVARSPLRIQCGSDNETPRRSSVVKDSVNLTFRQPGAFKIGSAATFRMTAGRLVGEQPGRREQSAGRGAASRFAP